MFFVYRYTTNMSLGYAEIATHNHFAFRDNRTIFTQTAPAIKLPSGATEETYLGLLGLLNSSTGGFWLKQVCFPKGGDTVGQDGARVRKVLWDVYYAFDSTTLNQFPVPAVRPLVISKAIQAVADARVAFSDRKSVV